MERTKNWWHWVDNIDFSRYFDGAVAHCIRLCDDIWLHFLFNVSSRRDYIKLQPLFRVLEIQLPIHTSGLTTFLTVTNALFVWRQLLVSQVKCKQPGSRKRSIGRKIHIKLFVLYFVVCLHKSKYDVKLFVSKQRGFAQQKWCIARGSTRTIGAIQSKNKYIEMNDNRHGHVLSGNFNDITSNSVFDCNWKPFK